MESKQPGRDEPSSVARTPTNVASPASWRSSISVNGHTRVMGHSSADPKGGAGRPKVVRSPTPRLLGGCFAMRRGRPKQYNLLRTVLLDQALKEHPGSEYGPSKH